MFKSVFRTEALFFFRGGMISPGNFPRLIICIARFIINQPDNTIWLFSDRNHQEINIAKPERRAPAEKVVELLGRAFGKNTRNRKVF